MYLREGGSSTFELPRRERGFVGDESKKERRVFALVERWVAGDGAGSAWWPWTEER